MVPAPAFTSTFHHNNGKMCFKSMAAKRLTQLLPAHDGATDEIV
jgi:hypothetical protein